jgi:hypothetical protein
VQWILLYQIGSNFNILTTPGSDITIKTHVFFGGGIVMAVLLEVLKVLLIKDETLPFRDELRERHKKEWYVILVTVGLVLMVVFGSGLVPKEKLSLMGVMQFLFIVGCWCIALKLYFNMRWFYKSLIWTK